MYATNSISLAKQDLWCSAILADNDVILQQTASRDPLAYNNGILSGEIYLDFERKTMSSYKYVDEMFETKALGSLFNMV